MIVGCFTQSPNAIYLTPLFIFNCHVSYPDLAKRKVAGRTVPRMHLPSPNIWKLHLKKLRIFLTSELINQTLPGRSKIIQTKICMSNKFQISAWVVSVQYPAKARRLLLLPLIEMQVLWDWALLVENSLTKCLLGVCSCCSSFYFPANFTQLCFAYLLDWRGFNCVWF